MATALTLPASVRSRSCFTQYMGGLAIDQAFFDQAVHTIDKMGMDKIWEINEAQPPSMFSRSIWALAASMATAGLDPQMPKCYTEQLMAKTSVAIDGKGQPDAASQKTEITDEWGSPPYVITRGTAVIPVNGPLSKQPSSLEGMFGGSSTVGMRKALDLALADPQVERILFHIDSPGGTVAGTGDLGDDIFAASTQKPIASFIEDMGTSAAYWLASQTAHIYASQYANVGSIGVIWTVYDTSEAYEKEGIKVRAITSSPGKAFVVDGMPITAKQMAKMQAHVDSIYTAFLGVVARGREVSAQDARVMSGDADVYNAPLALEKGLIDNVMTFREALADFAANGKKMLRSNAPITMLVREKSSMPAQASSDSSAGERDSNSQVLIVPPEESSVTPDPEPAGQPAKAAPVTISAEEHKALLAKADQGAEALKIVQAIQAKQAEDAKAALASERERLTAEYPMISKEAVAACESIGALRALESVARAAGGKRLAADPKSGKGDEKGPQTLEQQVNTEADIKEWQAFNDARYNETLGGAAPNPEVKE